MSADHEQFRQFLCDAEQVANHAAVAIRKQAAEAPADVASLYVSVEKQFRTGAEIIGRTAESPIEKMLFQGLLLGCAIVDPFGFVVLEPSRDATSAIQRRREAHAAVRAAQQKGKKLGKSVDNYIDWLVREQGMTATEADFWRSQDLGSAIFGDAFHFMPQAVMKEHGAKKGTMRADALVYVPNRPSMLVAIECDGYEWHGNKESFSNDRQRDRALKAAGCEVLRFSGSEIYHQPNAAALDLYGQIDALRRRSPKPRRWKS